MSTAFNNIVTAMVTALSASPAVSPHIFRARTKPMAAEWTSAIVVRVQSAEMDPLALFGAPINVDTTVVIECYARSTTLAPDQAVDQVLQSAYARLAADPTLGGLVGDCNLQSINYDFDQEQERMGAALLTCVVKHRIQSSTLE